MFERLRRVERGVNRCVASKIGCVASGDWIHGGERVEGWKSEK